VSQPDTGEQALEIADMLIRSNALDIIVIDSVAALVPRAEIEGEMGDSHVGLQARLMSQALRKLTGALHNSKTTAIFINQLREKIGVMFGCFSYSHAVTLADGSQEKIGKIVNQKMRSRSVLRRRDAGRSCREGHQLVRQRPTESSCSSPWSVRGQRARAVRGDRQPPDPTPGGWREAGELLPVTGWLRRDRSPERPAVAGGARWPHG
jgi:recombination protein RecA